MSGHASVLLEEVCAALELKGDNIDSGRKKLLFDGTLGGGGHSEALLERNAGLFLVGMDRDAAAIERARSRLERFSERMLLVHGNFADLPDALRGKYSAISTDEEIKFDRMLLDLGISSYQMDDEERGFSFRSTAPLDMRMDLLQDLSADGVVNGYTERDLARALRPVGAGARRLAGEIVRRRPVQTTGELREICERVFPRRGERKHPAALPFMAIRSEVNREFESIERFMNFAPSVLAPRGILAVISFHSLEDKFVTRAMRRWGRPQAEKFPLAASVVEEQRFGRLLTPKAIRPRIEETNLNPRARSALLRVFQAQ